jgi:predicted RNA-binding Zn ribbon-like protein
MVRQPPPFLWLGEQLAIDFLNTEPLLHGERTELLGSFERLVAWCEEAGLASRAIARDALGRWGNSAAAERALGMAHRLRHDLRNALERRATGKAPSAASLESLNACLRLGGSHIEVARRDAGPWLVRRVHIALSEPAQLLTPVAEAGAKLLCDIDPELVRRCGNPGCVLYFHDVSKNHARRWCSMALCGNRMKAAAHYERQRRAHKAGT